jgi:glycosyltransferase involved in cell wall biosynthesis
MGLDLVVLGQDPLFAGGALAQTNAFLSAARELGREPELLYAPNPGLRGGGITWRRIEALREVRAGRTLERQAHDARSCWVVGTVAHYGAAAPRSGRSYGCWLGASIASEWKGRAAGLSALRRLASGASVPTLRSLEREVVRNAAAVYATSPASAAQIAAGTDLPSSEIGLLPIPVDSTVFIPEADAGWLERATTAPLIGFVGRADDPRKNVTLLLDAYELVRDEIPAASLVLVGSRPSVPTRPEVKGVVPEVAPLLRRCTLLALPSFQEGFGVVVAESLASGVPAVVTPCGGPEEIVRSSGAGRISPGWSPRQLADCLLELLGDPEGLKAARTAGRAFVVREHAPDRFRDLLSAAIGGLDG